MSIPDGRGGEGRERQNGERRGKEEKKPYGDDDTPNQRLKLAKDLLELLHSSNGA